MNDYVILTDSSADLDQKMVDELGLEVLPLTFLLVAALYLGQEVWQGMVVQDNVSNLSHILGGATGAVIGYRSNKK